MPLRLYSFFPLIIISCFLFFNTGCSGLPNSAPPAKTLAAISISPAAFPLIVGGTQQLTATATYSDGSKADVSASASWNSSNKTVATVNAAGMVAAVAAGTAAISANLSGQSGGASVTVGSLRTLVSISITPATAALTVGGTQQLTATASYSDGSIAIINSSATWTSSNSTIATVNSAGLVTAVAVGTATISANLSGQSGSAAMTVQSTRSLVSISISPATATVPVGGTQQLTATASYSDGATANISSSATWTSSNSTIASVNSAGLVTAVAVGTATISANLSGQSGSAAVTVPSTRSLVSISITPASSSLTVGGTQQLTATANYSDGSTANISSSATWTSSNSTIATVNATGMVAAAAAGNATITASSSNQTATSTIAVGANVVTWHNDNLRSGLNAAEGILTPQNVNPQRFGKLYSYIVDGYIYAQPLFVSNLSVSGSFHNVVFVATENDRVYAFDSDNFASGSALWHVSLLQAGETPITVGSIKPYLGITSTPAIDLTSHTMYVVSAQESSPGRGTFRLHALDITNGTEKFGGPVTIQASVPGTNQDSVNGVVNLTTQCVQRAALLVANGSVFIGFGSCHSGWLLAYDAQTLSRTGVFNSSPNLNGEGAYLGAGGVWMSGGGPAADDLGNVYITTGNGPYDGQTAFGDSVLKFDSKLTLLDHFTPHDYQYMDCADKDLAGGGLLLIPGSTEALAGGKNGKLYLVNTSGLGGMQADDAGATQTLWFESDKVDPYSTSCTDSHGVNVADINSYEIFATSAFFNGSIYLGITPTLPGVPAPLRQFSYSGTLTPGASTSDNILENSYGTTPFISAAGTSSGIIWMIDHGQPIQSSGTASSAILRAFDATNLGVELYDSSQNSSDVPGYGIKFTSPIVANGKVFIGTAHDPISTPNPTGEVDIYGLKN